jgi:hypothetical protein
MAIYRITYNNIVPKCRKRHFRRLNFYYFFPEELISIHWTVSLNFTSSGWNVCTCTGSSCKVIPVHWVILSWWGLRPNLRISLAGCSIYCSSRFKNSHVTVFGSILLVFWKSRALQNSPAGAYPAVQNRSTHARRPGTRLLLIHVWVSLRKE